MEGSAKKLRAVFFCQQSGNEPVREFLKGLGDEDRKIIGVDIARVEFGRPVGMPVCRSMGSGLYEVRSTLTNRIARVLFFVTDGQAVLLHSFIKKTQATPRADLELATERMNLVKAEIKKEEHNTKKGKR